MWHCSVEQILAAVRDGKLPSRLEGQFLLVAVNLPEGPPVKPRHHVTLDPPGSRPQPSNPSREEIVTPQEMAALAGAGDDEPSGGEDQGRLEAEQEDQETAEAPLDISQWRIIRRRTSLLRRPPRKTAAVSAP